MSELVTRSGAQLRAKRNIETDAHAADGAAVAPPSLIFDPPLPVLGEAGVIDA
ncbi:MAG: hypothetical protein ACREQB_12025 [Candidatus Binataceae bacterium]